VRPARRLTAKERAVHYLVTITPTIEAADALDAGPGGPGPLFEFIADRYQPVMFWSQLGAAPRPGSST
jgi:hypothetical protein